MTRTYLILALITVVRAVGMYFYKIERAPTIDELYNLLAIEKWFSSGGIERIRPQTMPVHFPLVWLKNGLGIPFEFTSIFYNSIQIPLFFYISRVLFKKDKIALILTLFLALEPNLLAHSMLPLTMDAYLATHTQMIFAAFFFLQSRPHFSHLNSAVLGILVGLSLAVKLTGAFYIPLFALLWVLVSPGKRLLNFVFYSIGAWLGVCAGYGFIDLMVPLKNYSFYSSRFQTLQGSWPELGLPAPMQLVRSLDFTLFFDQEKKQDWIYILGQNFNARPVWYYFLICFLFKLPFTSLIAPTWALYRWVRNRLKVNFSSPWFPISFYFLVLFYLCSFKLNSQLGIRYILPALPLFVLCLGYVRWNPKRISVALVYLFLSLSYNHTNLLGYFNEFAPIKHKRYLLLADSNLSWFDLEPKLLRHLESLPETDSHGQKRPLVNPKTIPSDRDFYLEVNSFLSLVIGCPICNDVRRLAKPYDSWGEGAYLKFRSLKIDLAAP